MFVQRLGFRYCLVLIAISTACSGLLAPVCLAQSGRESGTASSEERDVLKSFLLRRLRARLKGEDKTTRYLYASVDLNGDGTPEIIVYLTGREWCGSGGCPHLGLVPQWRFLQVSHVDLNYAASHSRVNQRVERLAQSCGLGAGRRNPPWLRGGTPLRRQNLSDQSDDSACRAADPENSGGRRHTDIGGRDSAISVSQPRSNAARHFHGALRACSNSLEMSEFVKGYLQRRTRTSGRRWGGIRIR